jgi:hypothetical protein
MDRVINRVIPNFVALCNKLVFCPIFTRVGLKNQVGQSDFTWVGLTLPPWTSFGTFWLSFDQCSNGS